MAQFASFISRVPSMWHRDQGMVGLFLLLLQGGNVLAQDPGQYHSALLSAKVRQNQEERNKKIIFDLWREVVDGRHEELINKYIAEDYIDHNPNLASGRAVYVARFKSEASPHSLFCRDQKIRRYSCSLRAI